MAQPSEPGLAGPLAGASSAAAWVRPPATDSTSASISVVTSATAATSESALALNWEWRAQPAPGRVPQARLHPPERDLRGATRRAGRPGNTAGERIAGAIARNESNWHASCTINVAAGEHMLYGGIQRGRFVLTQMCA